MAMKETARAFFDACQTGKGWAGCEQYCHPDATFSSQTGALAGVTTLQQYTDWMKGLYGPCPDASYEVRSFAVDDERKNVAGYGVFRATHTRPGRFRAADRQEGRSRLRVCEAVRRKHKTKIWNNTISLQQLGWA
jgi:hypothetical protein